MVKPVTVVDVAVVVAVMPPGLDVTVKSVIAAPPLEAGTLQLTVACAFPRVAVISVGVAGTVAGVTAFDSTDDVLAPTEFVAVTVNV